VEARRLATPFALLPLPLEPLLKKTAAAAAAAPSLAAASQ
jgi:hypothetical protein